MNQENMSTVFNPFITKERVIQNPFHPLDLSAHDLLIIYKRFDISSKANRNPQQELSIELIAQLISSIKGCKPSYIQKCLSQALIKNTMSWNDFLAFLDQESEVRHKIIDWLLHQKAIIKYNFKQECPFRHKICPYFDEITHLNFVELGSDSLMCAVVDYKKIILINLTEGLFLQIDRFVKKDQTNKKKVKDEVEKTDQSEQQKNDSHPIQVVSELKHSYLDENYGNTTAKNYGHVKSSIKQYINKNNFRTLRKSDKKITKNISTQNKQRHDNLSLFSSSHLHKLDDETYFKKERKNIHSIFSLFTQLPLEESQKVATLMSDRIRNRNVNASCIGSLKEKYSISEIDRKFESYNDQKDELKPIQKAKRKLNSLYKQKQQLSYNPYKAIKTSSGGYQPIKSNSHHNPVKKLGFERKQIQYFMQTLAIKFNKQLNCFAVIYYNLQMSLIRVMREYNKIVLSEQDSIKVGAEKDHKKNQIVESVDFYKHRITNKWFLLVLFRVQKKNDHNKKNGESFIRHNQSYIKGYEIIANKNKSNTMYRYVDKKEQFVIELGDTSIIEIYAQPQYGIHAISHDRFYLICKQYYETQAEKTIYWKMQAQQNLGGAVDMSLTCINVSPQLNKSLIGTIKGLLIIYDLFSHQYKIKKVGFDSIVKIIIKGECGYLLTGNQKIIIYDIIRSEQIQVLNVRNEERLHEKIMNFELNKNQIHCYGTCIRVFEEVVDASMQHEKLKMTNMYTWRLNKLPKTSHDSPKNQIKRTQETHAAMVITSPNFIITLTEIHEAIFFSVKDMTVKFTIILDLPYDAKIMKIAFSEDQKHLGVLLFNQNIYVFNVYTQELFLRLKFNHAAKYTTLAFLDSKNQYFMAAGTQSGTVNLHSYPSTSQKKPKLLQLHKKPLTITLLRKDFLLTASQDQLVGIWQLPFNFLRHEIDLKKVNIPDFMSEPIGHYLEYTCFLKSFDGVIYQIELKRGTIQKKENIFNDQTSCLVDNLTENLIVGEKNTNKISIWEKDSDRRGWKIKKEAKMDSKHEIIGIGLIASEKAIFFTGHEYKTWEFKRQKPSKNIELVHSIL